MRNENNCSKNAGGNAPAPLPLLRRVFDYINRNRHLLLILYLPIYFIWFFLIEKYITTGYQVSYIEFDDKIPFLPGFILLYVLWYPYMVFTGLYLLWKDVPSFKHYMWVIIIGFSASLLICTLFPNGQDLRPDLSGQKGFCIWLTRQIYSADTNTNVFPSMHVVGCAAVFLAAFESDHLKKLRVPLIIAGALIGISTVFVKQHSILDVIAGVVLGAIILACFHIVKRARSSAHERQP